MDRSVEDKIRDLELKIESEVSRLNSMTNSKASSKELAEWKDTILEAYEDVKNDCRYLLKELIKPKKKESNKLNKIFVIINVMLVIANILIIIGGK
jgi:hypothetical protein